MPRYDLGLQMSPWDNYISIIYPVNPPNRVRDRPMKVLALGMSRSGTDSLRAALQILGYQGVYHGWEMLYNEVHDHEFWIPWLKKKHVNVDYDNPRLLPDLTATELDKALGKYEAVTDAPCYCFSQELLAAYPDAKVIINRRKDMEAWRSSCKDPREQVGAHRYHVQKLEVYLRDGLTHLYIPWWQRDPDTSFEKTIKPILSDWFLFITSRFCGQLFWIRRHWYLAYIPYFKYDFGKYGMAGAEAHYANVNKLVKEQNRRYLDWTVEEGWEPLCRFLEKEIPDEPFPRMNVGIQGVTEKYSRGIEYYIQTALINMAAITCWTGIGIWWMVRRSRSTT